MEQHDSISLRNRLIAFLDETTVSRDVATIEEYEDFWPNWFRTASPVAIASMLEIIANPPRRERSSRPLAWTWDDEAGVCLGAWGNCIRMSG